MVMIHELDSVRLVMDTETSSVESSCSPAASPTGQRTGAGDFVHGTGATALQEKTS